MTQKRQKEMANRIKKQRKAAGYTQDTFSEAIGISMSSYSKIENAFQSPSLSTIILIADKLNISIDYFVYGFEKEKPENTKLESLLNFANNEMLLHTSEVISQITKMKSDC
jgi:transcriptional regulator with XRE-family HTH domain